MSHYSFAQLATRVLAVAFDTTGRTWVVHRQLIAGIWTTTLATRFKTQPHVELTAGVTAGQAAFGAVQLAGWPVNYEDPYLVTLGGLPGLGAANELPPHPLVGNTPTPKRYDHVVVSFRHRAANAATATHAAVPSVSALDVSQGNFSNATFDLGQLLSATVPDSAAWFALRFSGANTGYFAFNNAVFDGDDFDAAGNPTPFVGRSRFDSR